MKEWFGLMFSRNAIVFYVVVLIGFGIWCVRAVPASVKDIVQILIGIVMGYFTGKFASDQPGANQKG